MGMVERPSANTASSVFAWLAAPQVTVRQVTIVAVPTARGMVSNSGVVGAEEADANRANSTASITTDIGLQHRVFFPLVKKRC